LLAAFRRRVGEAALLEMDALDAVEAEVAALIDRAVETAQAAPLPPESALLTDVYASYEGSRDAAEIDPPGAERGAPPGDAPRPDDHRHCEDVAGGPAARVNVTPMAGCSG